MQYKRRSRIDVEKVVNEIPIISDMMKRNEIIGVLENLYAVLEKNIPGDIVELGCNIGTTSIFIRKFLDIYGSNKKFHVYDSWKGLPKITEKDKNNSNWKFFEGQCKTSKGAFINTFKKMNLELPIIHSGWFKDIADIEYPEKICFAFFDGDFYTSIIDSFNKTFYKIQRGGIIIIDDCKWGILPGVKKACDDFLHDKEEILELNAYSSIERGMATKGGKMVKI